ncbi:TPA: hypothetical protein QC286_005559, partial [Bacillus cereus]|nr:hypothetical protein [Bacillus cereus]
MGRTYEQYENDLFCTEFLNNKYLTLYNNNKETYSLLSEFLIEESTFFLGHFEINLELLDSLEYITTNNIELKKQVLSDSIIVIFNLFKNQKELFTGFIRFLNSDFIDYIIL